MASVMEPPEVGKVASCVICRNCDHWGAKASPWQFNQSTEPPRFFGRTPRKRSLSRIFYRPKTQDISLIRWKTMRGNGPPNDFLEHCKSRRLHEIKQNFSATWYFRRILCLQIVRQLMTAWLKLETLCFLLKTKFKTVDCRSCTETENVVKYTSFACDTFDNIITHHVKWSIFRLDLCCDNLWYVFNNQVISLEILPECAILNVSVHLAEENRRSQGQQLGYVWLLCLWIAKTWH